ncbi:uncharacterized protein B0H18DRAFT_1022385 [Fomitopsis serialis]|uniref:uncharacterized protein n=1 Tax=Fomitopsis serialis TaxID=139415 RepID=UPI0020086C0E|nr:uncharacterized protein B0H18DRAFT_1022385 [Neoantrodia serialis]KAH9921029.1 hypothetical protein B0H18DRAFT_1022385 [Neoantrodia serialis]
MSVRMTAHLSIYKVERNPAGLTAQYQWHHGLTNKVSAAATELRLGLIEACPVCVQYQRYRDGMGL